MANPTPLVFALGDVRRFDVSDEDLRQIESDTRIYERMGFDRDELRVVGFPQGDDTMEIEVLPDKTTRHWP